MIPFLLAAVLALTPRAAAQTDAAFASALGQGPSFAVLAQLKTKPQKPAAPKPIAASDSDWQKALENVKKDGKYKPEAGLMPGTFTIEETSGAPKGDRIVREISVLGLLNDDGQFEPMGVVLILKEYKLDPKNGKWHVEHWMFQTDVYGTVEDASHGTIVSTVDGKSTVSTPDKLAPADPKVKAQFDAMLKHWSDRKPKGT